MSSPEVRTGRLTPTLPEKAGRSSSVSSAQMNDEGSASSYSLEKTESLDELESDSIVNHDIDRGRTNSKSEKALLSKKEIDRSDWVARFRQKNPEIAELQERLTPIERVVKFGEIYVPRRDEIQATLSKDKVTQLILQHLQFEGLKQSRAALESATKRKLDLRLMDLQESRLVTTLRIALKEVERVYDLTMPDKFVEDEELEDQLYEFGLLEEDPEAVEDTNIWEEPEEDNYIFHTPPGSTKPVIKAATLNKLVVQLTPERDNDMDFQKTFLMTYQSFTTPEKLLQKLIQRYQVPEKYAEGKPSTMTNTIQVRVVNVLKRWLGSHWEDLSEQHIESFRSFLNKQIKGTSEKLYNQLQSVLARKNQEEEKKALVFSEPPPDPKVVISTIFSPKLDLFDIDDIEIARQFTILEYELFKKIKPSELLNQAWNKPKLRHRATNVLNLINRSTEVSGWVASVIMKENKLRNRSRILTRLIKIAEQLRKLNNFSTLMAFIAGINNSAVYRLKFTKEEVPRQYQQILEQLMSQVSSQNAYKNYRDLLTTIQPPGIPYLGVYLTDLTFIDDGNPNFLASPKEGKDLINFNKRKMVYNVIEKIQQFQQSGYNLQPVHQILTLLKTDKLRSQRLDEKEMWSLSQIFEPRDADRASIA